MMRRLFIGINYANAIGPAHRLTLTCALLHFLICGVMAWLTGSWQIWLVIGIPALAVPAWLIYRYPNATLSRLTMAAGYMTFTALIIQQSGGDMEAHFSFFVMMSVLVVYCDWKPLVLAFCLIILHHFFFTVMQPNGIGLYVWNDERSGWGHLLVHGIVGTIQTCALVYLANMLRKRHELEIENAALVKHLRVTSERMNRDSLTGLYNRNHLVPFVENLAHLVAEGAQTVIVALIDIDHFKAVNDRYGHSAGDDVLVAVSETISREISACDCAVRHGGEEFLVALQSLDLSQAEAVCNRIRTRVSVLVVSSSIGPITVTASIGLARWERTESFQDVFQRADAALYRAKKAGRNRIVVDSSSDIFRGEGEARILNGRKS